MNFPLENEPQSPPQDAQPPAEAGFELPFEPAAEVSVANAESPSEPENHLQIPGFYERPIFASVIQPEVRPAVRIPHLGHLLLLLLCAAIGIVVTGTLSAIATHFHLYKISGTDGALGDIRYTLLVEVALYFFAFIPALFTFPILWHKGFFEGVQWNGATALRLRWRLIGTGFLCFLIAIANIVLFPGPKDAPIEKVFRQPGAAWLLFAFGVTFAPFFEEMFFRGFLLPSLCTAYDWLAEKFYHKPKLPLMDNGHPQWSLSAMAIASIVTSVPFALMHAHQTGDSVSVVILLGCVSLVLCTVRLVTRSLAASVMVHSFYNFLIFSIMLAGTQGFQHLDKM